MKLAFVIVLSLVAFVNICSLTEFNSVKFNDQDFVLRFNLKPESSGESSITLIDKLLGSVDLKSFGKSREFAYLNNLI
jgi:hypothetical protein